MGANAWVVLAARVFNKDRPGKRLDFDDRASREEAFCPLFVQSVRNSCAWLAMAERGAGQNAEVVVREDDAPVVGTGRFARVLKGHLTSTGEPVAVKRVEVFEGNSRSEREETLREARVLQSMQQHPCILRCMKSELDHSHNELVLVLEWADGGDLSSRLALRKHGLPEATALSVTAQVLSALSHMHMHRVLHRDVKPSNVFLMSSGAVKLGDLGLSRPLSSNTNAAESFVGTPFYISPERIRGEPYAYPSDVWAAGCMLHELLTLTSPFYRPGLNFYTLGRAILNCDFNPLTSETFPLCAPILHSLLQKSPSARPGAAEAHALVADAMSHCPPNAPSPVHELLWVQEAQCMSAGSSDGG